MPFSLLLSDIGTATGWAAIAFIVLVFVIGLMQLVIVPATASRLGKDAGLWLLITIVWLLFEGAAGLVAWFFGIVGAVLAFSGRPLGLVVAAVCLLIYAVMMWLPWFAVGLGGPRSEAIPRTRARGTYRPPPRRGVRGRRFSSRR